MDVVVRVLHDAVALLQREGDPGLIVGVREICERSCLSHFRRKSIFQGSVDATCVYALRVMFTSPLTPVVVPRPSKLRHLHLFA